MNRFSAFIARDLNAVLSKEEKMKAKMLGLLVAIMLMGCLSLCAAAEDITFNADNYSVGDVIVYGRYEKDNDLSNGSEPLQWIIIGKEENRMLLITRDSIDRMAYQKGLDSHYQQPKWSASTVRGWLNSDFIEMAFDESEQKAILLTEVDNSECDEENTLDRVFLLSVEEAQRYMPNDAAQATQLTEYARQKRGQLNTSEGWMLRTHTTYKSSGQSVYFARENGGISYSYIDGTSYYCVRPAMWITTSNEVQEYETGSAEPSEYSVGDRVFIGHFEQDGLKENGEEPIQWEILEIDGDYAILETVYAVDCQPFNYAHTPTAWSDSTLRYWLNTDFFNGAFTLEEQSAIVPISPNEGHSDKVSLRSEDEIGAQYREKMKYNGSEVVSELQKSPTRAVRQQWGGGGLYTQWWVKNDNDAYNATYLNWKGEFGGGDVETVMGICPLIKVNLRAKAVYKDKAVEETQRSYGIPDIVNLGDYVSLGNYISYNTKGYASDEAGSLGWEVIAVRPDRVLLWSNSSIAYTTFSSDRSAQTWEDSDLRKWLNETFYSEAFSAEEQKMIKKSEIGYHLTQSGDYEGGSTQDYIFCLSLEELKEYRIKKSDVGMWLRNAGNGSYGAFWEDIYWYSSPHLSSQFVRPAMWVDKVLLEDLVSERKRQEEVAQQAAVEEAARPDSINNLLSIMDEIAEKKFTRRGAMARADYDGDGDYEAFALMYDRWDWEQYEVWFVDPDGTVKLSEAEVVKTFEVVEDSTPVYARIGMGDGRVVCWTIVDGEPVSMSEDEVLQLASNQRNGDSDLKDKQQDENSPSVTARPETFINPEQGGAPRRRAAP